MTRYKMLKATNVANLWQSISQSQKLDQPVIAKTRFIHVRRYLHNFLTGCFITKGLRNPRFIQSLL